jgi:predicted TPR repeat methyltransferase
MTRNWVVVAAVIFLVVAASSSEPVPPTASYTEEDAQSANAAVRIGNHLREGNDALASGDYRAAIRSYEACLALDPDERYCNINYASSLVDDVYRNNGSEEEEEEEEDGRDDVDEREDRMARAVSALRRVLRLHPRDGDAAFNLALLLQDTSKSEEVTRESAMLYQIAVQAMEGSDPDDGGGGGGGDRQWDALANLAAARQELGEHFGPYGSIRCYERSIVLLEGITQEYNDYIDMMVNEYDAAGSTTMEEYDEEGYRSAQTQVLAMNAYASKLYYGYGTILSELSPSDCLRLTATEKSLLIDTERTTTFAIRAVGDAGDGEGRDDKSARVACEANALNAMRMAVNLDGNNALAIHILAAMTGGGDADDDSESGYASQERASNEFVSALFDDFADTFDEKLGALAYQVPRLVGEAAYDLLRMSSREETFDSILDAGCGTGLAGRFLRPLVGGTLVGVDLSSQMLQKAARCTFAGGGCGLSRVEEDDSSSAAVSEDDAAEEVDERASRPLYDKLTQSDLEAVTLTDLVSGITGGGPMDGFDLIVAADVFVYIGNLEKILRNFAKLSNGNDSRESYLIFSCERIDDGDDDDDKKSPSPSSAGGGWKVQISGRYAHTKSYVTGVAKRAGFDLLRYDEIVPRMEKGEEVKGHMFIFVMGGEVVADDEHDELDGNYEYGVHVQVFKDEL